MIFTEYRQRLSLRGRTVDLCGCSKLFFYSNVLDSGGQGTGAMGGFIPGWSKCKRRISPQNSSLGKEDPPPPAA